MNKNLRETSHEIIEVFDAPDSEGDQVYSFKTDELTALCPFDFGGPDYYVLTLRYTPTDDCIESKSLKKYIQSFRDTEISAESLGAKMFNTIQKTVEPKKLYVRLEQARRGGVEETVEIGDVSLRPNS
ncbi:preQ(1) synthase [Halovenus halobia]|uniref:preQ(1) synthase n=1 Tax=Halovenus halobia TaxID=3396622 RepID=UPI003F56A565